MTILADVAVAPAAGTRGLPVALALLVLAVLIETVVLNRLKWGTWGQTFRDVTVANVISTIIGMIVYTLLLAVGYSCGRIPTGDGVHFLTHCGWNLSPFIVLLIMAALSILVEGGVLLRRRVHPAGQTWRAALLGNLASYLLLSPLFLLALFAA
jgi:cell shape-determining protein MreD